VYINNCVCVRVCVCVCVLMCVNLCVSNFVKVVFISECESVFNNTSKRDRLLSIGPPYSAIHDSRLG
jgi:hypothetical protein